jgi:predicted Zn-dependent protease
MKRCFHITAAVIPALLLGCVTPELKGLSPHLSMLTTTVKETSKASRPISDEEEYYVGRAVAARLLSRYALLEDRMLTEYVGLIGQAIALHSDKPFTYGGYHFAVLKSDDINAFACPGGMIFITRGMVNLTRNEDELAAVLAHEIAHVNHRDGISSIKNSRWTEALAVIGSQGMKTYGSAELSQLVGIFEGSIDDVFKALVVNGYGQSQEHSADETALSYLSKAGYDPSALGDFLKRLVEQGHASEGGIMKTHPATPDRIKNIAQKMPADKADTSLVQSRSQRFKEILK